MDNNINLNIIAIRFLVAFFVGGLIGFERERHHRDAGFRTHILVCIGACIISLLEMKMEQSYIKQYYEIGLKDVGIVLTRGRLAAQVISGIGFLGAGTIIFNKGSIKGLTTAASLWVVACLGLAVGYGHIDIAILGGILSVIVLHLLISIQEKFINKKSNYTLIVTYIGKKESMEIIEEILSKYDVKLKSYKHKELENKLIYKIYTPKHIKMFKVANAIMLNDYVEEVNLK